MINCGCLDGWVVFCSGEEGGLFFFFSGVGGGFVQNLKNMNYVGNALPTYQPLSASKYSKAPISTLLLGNCWHQGMFGRKFCRLPVQHSPLPKFGTCLISIFYCDLLLVWDWHAARTYQNMILFKWSRRLCTYRYLVLFICIFMSWIFIQVPYNL